VSKLAALQATEAWFKENSDCRRPRDASTNEACDTAPHTIPNAATTRPRRLSHKPPSDGWNADVTARRTRGGATSERAGPKNPRARRAPRQLPFPAAKGASQIPISGAVRAVRKRRRECDGDACACAACDGYGNKKSQKLSHRCLQYLFFWLACAVHRPTRETTKI